MRAVVLAVEPRQGAVDGRHGEEYVARAASAPGERPPAASGAIGDRVFHDPVEATAAVLGLLRERRWHLGLGVGERAGAVGDAHVAAREAVLRARTVPARVAVSGDRAAAVERLETVLWLTAALLSRRTDRGWEVADLLAEGLTHQQVGDRLGITQSAVSQRARAAGVVESQRAEELVRALLVEAIDG